MLRTLKLFAMHGNLKYKLKRGGKGRPVITGEAGASRSADGTSAQVEQVIDRETKLKRKRVVLADGTVAKDYEGPIDGGHGDPRTWSRLARLRLALQRKVRPRR